MRKYFNSRTMKNIPALTNNQGDLVSMLDTLLSVGIGSPSIIMSVEHLGSTLHKIVFDEPHLFSANMVVSINDNEYRVHTSSITHITIKTDTPSFIVGDSVSVATLGWDIAYSVDGGSCYKSRDVNVKEYIRVDDRKFADTNANAAKSASVELCLGMTSFDDAIKQSPFNSTHPTQNRAFISGRSNGWYKWFYSCAYTNNPDKTVSPTGIREYILIGDDTEFILVIFPYATHPTLGCMYGVHRVAMQGKVELVITSSNGYGLSSNVNYPHLNFVVEADQSGNSCAATVSEVSSVTGVPYSSMPVMYNKSTDKYDPFTTYDRYALDTVLVNPVFFFDVVHGKYKQPIGKFLSTSVTIVPFNDAVTTDFNNELYAIINTGRNEFAYVVYIGE